MSTARRPVEEEVPRLLLDLQRRVNELALLPSGNHAIVAKHLGVLPGCRVYSSVTQTAVNGNAPDAMAFDSERYDTDSMWTISNPTVITINTAGRYDVGGIVNYPADGTGNYRSVTVRLNGTSQIASSSERMPAATGGAILDPSAPWDFNAGDFIELVTAHDASTNLTIPASSVPPAATCAVIEFWAEWKSHS